MKNLNNQINTNSNLGKSKNSSKFAIALFLALSTAGTGLYFYDKYKEKEESKNLNNFVTMKYLLENQVIEDFDQEDGKCKEKQKQWIERYKGNDPERDKKFSGNHTRKILLEGFTKMLEAGDDLLLKKLIDQFNQQNNAKIPYDIIFLALTESARNPQADSGVAGGYWQFTPSSAKLFGLEREDRIDKIESTKAAMRHLRENYELISNYARLSQKTLSESDKRSYAFWMYNASPKLVRAGFGSITQNKSDDGIIANYFDNIDAYAKTPKGARIHASETKGYVPRILAIRSFLAEKLRNGEFSGGNPIIIEPDSKKEIDKDSIINNQHIKTEADKLFEYYQSKLDNITEEQSLKLLEQIKSKYLQEKNTGKISLEYYEGAIAIIDKEIESLKDEDTNDEQIGTFVAEGLDQKGTHEVYSYIIKKHGSPSLLKKKFSQQYDVPVSDIIVTNAKGKEYPDNYVFPKNKCVFIKKEIKQGFDFIRKSSDNKYNIYSYVIKKGGSSGAVLKQFVKQNHKHSSKGIIVTDRNGKEYKDIYFYPGTKVYLREPRKK